MTRTILAAAALALTGVACGGGTYTYDGSLADRPAASGPSTTSTTSCPRLSQGSFLRAYTAGITGGYGAVSDIIGPGELSGGGGGYSTYIWESGYGMASMVFDGTGAVSHHQVGLAACGWSS